MSQRQEVKRKITLPLKREKRKKRKSKLFKNLENSSSSSNSENNKEKHNNRKENSQLNYLTEDNSQEIFFDISPPIEGYQNEIYEENEDNKILNDIWNSIESNNVYSIKSQPLGKMNMLRTKAKKLNFNEKFGNEENENLFLSKFQSKRTLNE